ncbi:MAG: hypothetical protein RIA69_08180 [Cyclobacteriaceae bacterium]
MNTATLNTPLGLVMKTDLQKDFSTVLNSDAMDFIIALHEKFNNKRLSLLEQRVMKTDLASEQKSHSADPDIEVLRLSTEPLDVSTSMKLTAKTLVNSDFSPKYVKQLIVSLDGKNYEENCQEHQAIFEFLRDQNIDSSIYFEPRSLATREANLSIHELEASAALYDFGLYFFNNAYELVNLEKNPSFTLSGIYSAEEAKWWNDVFVFAQSYIGLPSGTIKAQVDLSTVPAIQNIEGILFELKQHLVFTSFDTRAYLISHVKRYFQVSRMTMPNLDQISIESPFLTTVIDYIVHSSHRMSVPCIVNTHISNDLKRDFQLDFNRVVDKGFDGAFVRNQAEADYVNDLLSKNNQISNKRLDLTGIAINLERTPTGTITEQGVAQCLRHFKNSIASSFSELTTDESLEILILKNWINHECLTVSGKKIDLNYCLSIR